MKKAYSIIVHIKYIDSVIHINAVYITDNHQGPWGKGSVGFSKCSWFECHSEFPSDPKVLFYFHIKSTCLEWCKNQRNSWGSDVGMRSPIHVLEVSPVAELFLEGRRKKRKGSIQWAYIFHFLSPVCTDLFFCCFIFTIQ